MFPSKFRQGFALFAVVVLIIMVVSFTYLTAKATFAEQTTFFNGTLSISTESSNNDADTLFSVVTADSAVKVAVTNPRSFSSTTATATLRMTNNCEKNATLYFTYDFTVEGNGSIAITSTGTVTDSTGSLADNSGVCSVMLATGGYVDINITSTGSLMCYDNYVNVTGISLVPAADAAEVTVNYDEANGSVTANGEAIGDGESAATVDGSITLKAEPTGDAVFVGWFDSNNSLISAENPYTMAPSGDTTINAVLTTDAMFTVDGVYYFDLNSAIIAAGNSKTIVLANTGTLPAGNYTIPAGVTLLIPNDTANTIYGATPSHDGANSYTGPSAYRTLTMASGANITVNGAISIAGKIGTAMGNSQNGAPSGPLGFINMADNSTITVNSGANLYAWGYIVGSGSVEIKDGGTVYEAFQIRDWRGGSVTSDMVGNTQKVFPLSQYYVQNIQVPLTLNAGATEMVATAMTILSSIVQAPCVEFIGAAGLYVVEDGCIIKDYAETTDQTVFTIKGDISISNLSITMQTGVTSLSKITINSKDYVLPIRSGMVVNVESGNVTVSQDMAICPGAEINIAEGATVTMGSGNSLFIYDADQWGKYCYFQGGNGVDSNYAPVLYVPTERADRSESLKNDGKLLVNGVFDASAGGIYTTTGGANIYSTGSGQIILGANNADSDLKTHQYSQIADGDDGYEAEVYIDIDVKSAKLKHENGGYLDTSASTTYYHAHYTCEHETGGSSVAHGVWYTEAHANTSVVTAPTCTEQGYTTHTCTCGHSYKDTYVPATGIHADENSDGVCDVCGTTLATYSVTISWGDMCFKYVPEYTWQTDTLSYAVTGGSWNPASEGSGNILISNAEASSGKVTAAATFEPEAGIGWTPGAVWKMAEVQVETVSEVKIDPGAKATINYAPSGLPIVGGSVALGDSATKIGQITITLNKEE